MLYNESVLTESWYHQDNQEDYSEGVVDDCQGACGDAFSHWVCGLYCELIEQRNGSTDKKPA